MPPSRKRILVVEDEFILRMLLSERVREEDFDVFGAANAEEALVSVSTFAPDLIISDVQMPGSMDGIGLLNAVKQIHPNIPLIIVSAHFDPAATMSEGADEFVAKPYTIALILAYVVNLLPKAKCRPAVPNTKILHRSRSLAEHLSTLRSARGFQKKGGPQEPPFRSVSVVDQPFGIMTVSMTWITPLVHSMSAEVTVAPLTMTPLEPSTSSVSPETELGLIFLPATSAAITFAGIT